MGALREVDQWPYCDWKTKEEWPKASPEGTAYYPSSTRHVKGASADWDNAREQFPARTEDEWVRLFDRAPHIMAQLLGDIFRETKAEEERRSGKARIGRRPKAIDGSLDELYDMITPKYATEPFAEAMKPLIDAAPSLRAFASRVPMNHHTLTRMMRGELPIEKWRLEQIAKAARVQPAYFLEYREAVIVEAMTSLLRAKPNLSIKVHKQLRAAKRGD